LPGKTSGRMGTTLALVFFILAATFCPGLEVEKKHDEAADEYESALAAGKTDQAVRQMLGALNGSDPTAALEAMAAALAPMGDEAVPALESVVAQPCPAAPAAAAELLWMIAQKGRLSNGMAALAGKLLADEDPFARALAEWAIAVKVQLDNGGQEIRWPRPDPPGWFKRWRALGPDFLLEADYARLAIVWGVHRKGTGLLNSVGKIIERAQGAASEIPESAPRQTRAMVARQLKELEAIRQRLVRRLETAPDDIVAHRRLWLDARRAARPIVFANPAIDFDKLVFILRHPAHSHRNITGSQYPWVYKPGGDICVKTGLDPSDRLRHVIGRRLGPGHVHGIDLWWDADRVVFGWAAQPGWPPKWDTVQGNDVFNLRGEQEPTHIYEIRLDGTGLRQLTDHPYWSDLEPTYCANGDIVFASDRSGRSSECGKFTADHTVINIYAISPDGANLRRLSDNKDIDRYPHSLAGGLIGYTRWEYQERHFHEVHSFWTVRPDGTMADAVFNQHIKAPHGLRDTRSIPGGNKLVSIATGHHTFAYGPVVVIDPGGGPNASACIRSLTPHSLPQEGPPPGPAVAEGGVPDKGGLYQTPWALSERCFLVSYSHARPPSGTTGGDNAAGFAVYLIDVHGNKELIHRDLVYSCSFPIPLKKRPRPPLLPDATDGNQKFATCYVPDVYRGIKEVPRGSIKHLRIAQRVGWLLDDRIGAMRYIPGNAWERKFGFWAWAPARVIGTVPVESDGSAHFKVPVDTAVYFQALDAHYMEVRRMRSHITFQPGEVRGCVGCHETRPQSPAGYPRTPLALRREPNLPDPPAWGSQKLLGYEWLIQPIFDTHCVRCHAGDQPDGGIDLAGTRTDQGMYQSYLTLFGRRRGANQQGPVLVSVSDRFSGAGISGPKQFGSHQSRLIQVLLGDELHKKEVKLSRPEWIALVTWVDLNAPYYDTFYNRRPDDGGEPRRNILIDFPAPFTTTILTSGD